MPRKPALPTDEELKAEIRETLVNVMRNARKEIKRVTHECEFHPKYTGNGRGYKHQINVIAPDNTAIINACEKLLDRIEGKAATRKQPPQVKTTGRLLEELSDEELEALATEGEASAD